MLQRQELKTKQDQQPILSQSLMQALTILTLPALELESFLESKASDNLLLEWKEGFAPLPEIPKAISFFEHLFFQAQELFSQKELEAAVFLLSNLDEKGYLPFSLEELSQESSFSKEELVPILKKIQGFDPRGVAARSLKECILLQLDEKSFAYCFLKEHFEEVLQGKEIPEEFIKTYRTLYFRPRESFEKTLSIYQPPDITISSDKEITLYDPLEKLLFKEPFFEDPHVRRFLRPYLRSARDLFSAVQRRKQTLFAIANHLLKEQSDYFDGGLLKPLTVKSCALNLSMHPSTIARAIKDKILFSPLGSKKLSFFFSSSEKSSFSAKELLSSLIKQEKKPLSDAKLRLLLKNRGIDLSRRTIAKYRKKLSIVSSFARLKKPFSREAGQPH